MSTPPEHNVQLTYEQMQQVQQAMYFLAQNRNTPLFLPGNPTNGPTMYPPPNHAGLPQYAAQAGIPAPPGIFPQPMHTVASSASIPPSFQTSIPGSSRSSSSSIPPPGSGGSGVFAIIMHHCELAKCCQRTKDELREHGTESGEKRKEPCVPRC